MRPEKHSLTLRGHRTSVSLETQFWKAFLEIAKQEGHTINGLAAQIDEARAPKTGLATAMRGFILKWYQDRHEA